MECYIQGTGKAIFISVAWCVYYPKEVADICMLLLALSRELRLQYNRNNCTI